MSNIIQIKHGATIPTNTILTQYELGYMHNKGLYINDGGDVVQLTSLVQGTDKKTYLTLPTAVQTTNNTNKILVCDNEGKIYYKIPSDIRNEINAFSKAGGTISGDVTISGKLTANGVIVVDASSYGFTNPNTAGIAGTTGQLYFVVTG